MTQAFVEPAPAAPRRLWLRSLTSRLVAGVVALVILIVAAIGGSTYYFLRSYLLTRLDQQLVTSASQNSTFVSRCIVRGSVSGQGQITCFQAGPPQTVREWITVLTPTGGNYADVEGTNVSALQLSADERSALTDKPARTMTVSTAGDQLRVTALETPNGLFVVTGLSTGEVNTTLRRLIRLESLIGAAAVAVAVLVTTWGVRRGLRNLYRVTSTAQEVAAELSPTGAGLDRRVPVVEEGTEVGQLAESMNTLLAAVETQFAARLASEQRLRQFLADASHELRTPLTSIRGYAELARMQKAAGDEEHDNLGRIESEGTRMSRLVDDLLLLARGDADGAAQVEQRELVDVTDVLDDAVSATRAAFPARQIELHLHAMPAVLGDRDQLIRALRNLVMNAAVHTDPRRPITVTGWTDSGGAVVTVVDGGPGLPPDEAAHVFERFWRADKARSRARGGSGLGMSIVDTIVRAHGGSVRFDSTVEGGSTATVWLPAAG